MKVVLSHLIRRWHILPWGSTGAQLWRLIWYFFKRCCCSLHIQIQQYSSCQVSSTASHRKYLPTCLQSPFPPTGQEQYDLEIAHVELLPNPFENSMILPFENVPVLLWSEVRTVLPRILSLLLLVYFLFLFHSWYRRENVWWTIKVAQNNWICSIVCFSLCI